MSEINRLFTNEYLINEDIVVDDFEGFKLCIDTFEYDDKIKNKPVILWVHGGAWFIKDLDRKYCPYEHFDKFLKAGFVIISADYRLVDKAPFPMMLMDLKMIIKYIKHNAKKFNIDKDNIFVWGESAGGHLATFLALNKPVGLELSDKYKNIYKIRSKDIKEDDTIKAACIWYPPVKIDLMAITNEKDIEILIKLVGKKPDEDEVRTYNVSPYNFLHKDMKNIYLMHGNIDTLVDISQSEVLFEKLNDLKVENVKFSIIDNQGHGFFKGDEYYYNILDWFKEILAKKENLC